ncbi:MAG: hypothetical protein ACTS6G_03430 [Candidatus Hodgkinia cicadicola]
MNFSPPRRLSLPSSAVIIRRSNSFHLKLRFVKLSLPPFAPV